MATPRVHADIEERIGRCPFWEVSLKRGGRSQAVREGLVNRVVTPNSDMRCFGEWNSQVLRMQNSRSSLPTSA